VHRTKEPHVRVAAGKPEGAAVIAQGKAHQACFDVGDAGEGRSSVGAFEDPVFEPEGRTYVDHVGVGRIDGGEPCVVAIEGPRGDAQRTTAVVGTVEGAAAL